MTDSIHQYPESINGQLPKDRPICKRSTVQHLVDVALQKYRQMLLYIYCNTRKEQTSILIA